MRAVLPVVAPGAALCLLLSGCTQQPQAPPASSGYTFAGGFPTPETVQHCYDDADLSRAIEAYKFFYPTVSFSAGFMALPGGARVNHSAMLLEAGPKQVVFTPNSDTPYAMIPLDLSAGPIVVEMPAGALMGLVNDLNQRYVMDLGLPGPDAGKGGRHIILPPGYKGAVPKGYFAGMATTNRVFLAVRAIPIQGDRKAAIERMKTIKVHPLQPAAGFTELEWLDLGSQPFDMSCASFESGIGYWELLHRIVDEEPPYEPYRMNYGELAALGIEKGKPFAPDERMKAILEKAARMASAQMRVQSFADRRPERIAWPDRKWEWASLRPENGTFDLPAYQDLEAREKWFYQAVVESPAMFRRDAGAGSLYWLGLRDAGGAYLDGSKTYKLTVPLPVPARLFWSVTVYDPITRSQIDTDQGRAALRSLFELKDKAGAAADLYFGPSAPAGHEGEWIKTIPGRGWFSYFRIYGPEAPAFDGSWKPADFEATR